MSKNPLLIQQLDYAPPGTPENDAAKAWLTANGIPIAATPAEAVFTIFEPGPDGGRTIQIRLFDMFEYRPGHGEQKFVSMFGGFAKRERMFTLVAAPEDFGVKSHVGGFYGRPAGGTLGLTENQVREIVDEKFAALATGIDLRKAV